MRILFAAVVSAALAFPVAAGVSYQFDTASSGLTGTSMSGVVSAEGDRMRVDVLEGDGLMFPSHSFVIGSTSARSLTLVDPQARTVAEIPIDGVGGSIASLLQQLRGVMSLSISTPRVSVRDFGAGETLVGYQTRRQQTDTRFTVRVNGSEATLAIFFRSVAESWTTDALPAAYANLLTGREVRSGIPEVDRAIAAATVRPAGFPLKQIVTTTLVQNGTAAEFRTVTRISNIEKRAIAPSSFVVPAGYTRTASPLDKALGRFPK